MKNKTKWHHRLIGSIIFSTLFIVAYGIYLSYQQEILDYEELSIQFVGLIISLFIGDWVGEKVKRYYEQRNVN